MYFRSCASGVSVWHHSFPLVNSFYKTEAAIFRMQALLLEYSPSSFHYNLVEIFYNYFDIHHEALLRF